MIPGAPIAFQASPFSIAAPNLDMLRPVSAHHRSVARPGDAVASYWGSKTELPAAIMIREAIQQTGRDPSRLTTRDIDFLAAVDEFHCLGPLATIELAELAGIGPGARVLDIGSGIGGPSRRLAIEFGCEVVGLDITREYVDAAQGLAERLGLSPRRVAYRWGDGIDLPFPNRSFDFVWIQVASANIFKRIRLYSEIRRVLRTGGRAVFYKMLAGPVGPLHFPVPWALDETTNAILSPEAEIRALENGGLRLRCKRDVSQQAASWFHNEVRLSGETGTAPRLSFHVLLPEWGHMAFNQWRNLIERRLFFTYLVAEQA